MKVIVSYCLLLFLFVVQCHSQTLPGDVIESIETRIEQGINPSIVVGIVDGSGEHYFNFGRTSEKGTSVNEHTIYEIGSISKVFTATLLAQNVIEGKVKLDDPIKKYLPADVKVLAREGKEITLGNLSDHTSGLPRLPDNMSPADPANPYADYTVEQMYDFLSRHQLSRDPGEAYEYSNFAQGLLGHILALHAGVSYEKLMASRIAEPLGMKETKITLDEKMKKDLATGHSGGMEVKNWDIPTLAGAGAIRSSAHDMLLFLAANLGLTKTPLKTAMDVTHKVRHDKAGGMRVGLAWHIKKGDLGDVIWHNGGTGGYRAFAGFVKETGKGVVVLTNSAESVDDIGFHLLDPESALRTIKPGIAVEIRKIIDTDGLDAAKARYDELRKDKADEYDFSQNVINNLGYSYIDKNLEASLFIFKANVDLHPQSFKVYDSYGEALLKNGQPDQARENYQKSLELNPGNTNAIEKLRQMGAEVNVEIDVSPSVLETYVGTYMLSPGFNIVVTNEGKHLFGQGTGQGRFEMFARTPTEFYLKVVNAQVSFNLNDQSAVESLTLKQNGQTILGKKIQ
jgi:CubicO group peptidase (beta-lactamase class C family)